MKNVRGDFPLFREQKLVFLDSAASAQKPECVIEAEANCYRSAYANIHRGVYQLSETATTNFEATREKARSFLNAKSVKEIIFTRGATEGVNIAALSYGRKFLSAGDEVLVSVLEHHSNFVPWQFLCEEKAAKFVVSGLNVRQTFCPKDFISKLSAKTKVVALTMLSNALGVKVPVAEMIAEVRKRAPGAVVLLDAAQAVAHQTIDVQALGADFLVFSGHKLYGPSGTGVLWGREELLAAMPPVFGGGDMISSVTIEKTELNDLPYKFEAGTPNIAGIIALASALDYLSTLGLDKISAHEQQLVNLLEEELYSIKGVNVLGPRGEHHALIAFTVDGIHPHDLSQFLDSKDIAVRAGHHCAQPLLKALGINASTRASFGVYNSEEDVARFSAALKEGIKYFS